MFRKSPALINQKAMYTTLTTIKNYLKQKFGQQKHSLGWEVELGPIEKEGQAEKALFITLVRIEEETSVKQPTAQLRMNDEGKKRFYANPDVCINLYILISSYADYGLALQQINDTIYYLNSVYPDDVSISEEMRKLSIELQSPSAEQWSSMWQTLGGKVVPSVLYKVRMITIKAIESDKEVHFVEQVVVDEKSPLRFKVENGEPLNEEEQEELLRILDEIRAVDLPHISIQELRFLLEKDVNLNEKEQEKLAAGLNQLYEEGIELSEKEKIFIKIDKTTN